MIGLKEHKYLNSSKRNFDLISVIASLTLLAAVLAIVIGDQKNSEFQSAILFTDLRSFFFVVGGTFGCLLFQFDLATFFHTFIYVLRSFFSSPVKHANLIIEELDECIIKGGHITSLREGDEVTGELLNDIVHMIKEKLFYDEIEGFVTNKVSTIFLARKTAVTLLTKGSKIAPALGLLGTVIGLIEVLQSLDDPSQIGPAMSLALMTTAFGSILGSLVFTPLAGRLEHHNTLYIETHKLLMNRVAVLIQREDRRLDPVIMNKQLDAK